MFEEGLNWIKLDVLDSTEARNEGWVTFKAIFIQNGQVGVMQERSYFIYEDAQWFYMDGDISPD